MTPNSSSSCSRRPQRRAPREPATCCCALPHEVKDLFRAWLEQHLPLRAAHVMSLVQQARGGRDNDPRFGHRMRGDGPWADMLRARFELARKRLELDGGRLPDLDLSQFCRPAAGGQTGAQAVSCSKLSQRGLSSAAMQTETGPIALVAGASGMVGTRTGARAGRRRRLSTRHRAEPPAVVDRGAAARESHHPLREPRERPARRDLRRRVLLPGQHDPCRQARNRRSAPSTTI